MQLQPVRFIGHKIGPFDHIELNWHKDSRNTVIVGENGTGKTTLVAAMAACLSGRISTLSSPKEFERFTYSKESFAFFEFLSDEVLASSLIVTRDVEDNYLTSIWKKLNPNTETQINLTIGGPTLQRTSKSFTELKNTWKNNQSVTTIAAAYGSFRNLIYTPVVEFKEIAESPFKDILNPFTPTVKSNIPQWITNQYIRRALAVADNEAGEADSYLDSIYRIEQFLTNGLELPIKFHLDRNPIDLIIQQNGSRISINQLSDGTRSFLSWTLDYLSRSSRVNWKDPVQAGIAPGLIIVDEIDSHLHPEWQRRVMSTSSELLPETHIIATTHSPFVVGSADDTQVFRIVKDENHKLRVESSYDELFGYPADLILQKLFTDSLYNPSVEADLERLSELAGKLTVGQLNSEERQEYDHLMQNLAQFSPWVANLLAMANQSGA